jgi:hypothetical protein
MGRAIAVRTDYRSGDVRRWAREEERGQLAVAQGSEPISPRGKSINPCRLSVMGKTRCFSMNRRRNDSDRGHQHRRAAGLVLGQRHPRQELGKPVKKGPAEAGPLVACK